MAEKDPSRPREGFNRKITNVLPQDTSVEDATKIFGQLWQAGKQTVGGSYDEAGLGPMELPRVAQLWNIPLSRRQELVNWYNFHYPGTEVVFRDSSPQYEILNVVDSLPKHASKRYSTRALADITTIVAHHSVSPCDRSTYAIASFHVNTRGWPGCGYGYVIGCDGKIELTNYQTTISYHAGVAGYNNNEISIGMCLKDDFTSHPPTQYALDAARWLVQHIRLQLNRNLNLVRHKDMPGAATQCPGNSSPAWIGYIAGESISVADAIESLMATREDVVGDIECDSEPVPSPISRKD